MEERKKLEDMDLRIKDLWERSITVSNTLIMIKNILEKWDAQRDAERRLIHKACLNEDAVERHMKEEFGAE